MQGAAATTAMPRRRVDPVVALGRMAVRTEAVVHSRRAGYYRSLPAASTLSALDAFQQITLEAFLVHQTTARSTSTSPNLRCITCVKDGLGNQFLMIPLRPSRQVVGLVRIRTVPPSVALPLATLLRYQVSRRAMETAEQLDRALGQRVAWYVMPSAPPTRSSSSNTNRNRVESGSGDLTSEDVAQFLRHYVPAPTRQPRHPSAPSCTSVSNYGACGLESRVVRAA